MEDAATAIWNRACSRAGSPPEAPIGDRMLTLAITLDGMIQADGIPQQWETWEGPPEGVEALRWFGLSEAADLVAAGEELAGTADIDAAERFELEIEPRYYELDTTHALDEAFQQRLATHPEDFLPPGWAGGQAPW